MRTGYVFGSKMGRSEHRIRTRPPKFTVVHNRRMISSLLPVHRVFGLELAAVSGQHCSFNRWMQTALCSSRNALSFSLVRTTVSVVAMSIGNPDRSPLESIAEAQPKLRSALLRLFPLFHALWLSSGLLTPVPGLLSTCV
jgi:hypothetical protein